MLNFSACPNKRTYKTRCEKATIRINASGYLRNDGKTYEEIMGFIGCSYRSVAHWCSHGNPDDLESLKDQRSKGNYRKATPEYIEQLRVVVEQTPCELGYEFGRWTTARLATHLEQKTQIGLSSVQVGRILRQKSTATSGQSIA